MICKMLAPIFTNSGSTVDDDVLVADKVQNKDSVSSHVCPTETSVVNLWMLNMQC